MDLIQGLADIVVNTSYDDIPQPARNAAKKSFVDTIAALIAGSTAEGCGTIANMVAGWGGVEESSIVVFGPKVPSTNAVWANATMSRALDFDDVYLGPAGDHPSTTSINTALATCELLGSVSGKDAIAAIALGTDLILSIRKVNLLKVGSYPWVSHCTSAFTAAAVAGKLLKLDRTRMVHALGIAFSQLSGTMQGLQDGALSHRVHHGLMTRAGMLSALMAEQGITGPHNILQGTHGFYPTFFQNQYDVKSLEAGIDKGFRSLICDVSIKAYPGCAFNHPAIEATVKLAADHDIRPENVKQITVYANQQAHDVCFIPVNRKRKPQSTVDAQFSIPYMVAHALVYGDVFVDCLAHDHLNNPTLLELAGKVDVVVDNTLNTRPETVVPNRETIRMSDGKTHETTIEFVKGHPKNPMEMDDCVQKLRRCLAFAAKPLKEDNVEKAITMIRDLEKVDSVGAIPQLLVSQVA